MPARIDVDGTDTNCLIPVSDTPSFAITRLPGFGIPIVEGMSVSLKCEVDSNPASNPIWQRGKWPAEKRVRNSTSRRSVADPRGSSPPSSLLSFPFLSLSVCDLWKN